MNKKTIISNITVYSLSHALIDATCVATLFAIVALDQFTPQKTFNLIILYTVIAFATQPIFGLLVDDRQAPVQVAVLGIALVVVATLLLKMPVLAILTTSVGNALFHVVVGAVSLNLSPGKATLPGIYVAPGALGLMIGTLVGKSGNFVAWPFILLLTVAALSILGVPKLDTVVHNTLPGNLRWFETVILLLLFSIAIRGLVGLGLVLPWKSDTTLLIVLTSAIVLGKAVGGILGDKFGWAKVALSGLAIAAPLLTFFAHIPPVAIIGAFLFNLTMPITLTCLAEMLPGKNGFAFGLTALALIIGAMPTFTQLRVWTSEQAFIFAVILISITALYGGLKLYTSHFGNHSPMT